MKQCYYGNRGERGYHLLEESDEISDLRRGFLETIAEKYSDINQNIQCTQLFIRDGEVFLQHVSHEGAKDGKERSSVFCHQFIWTEEEFSKIRAKGLSGLKFLRSIEEMEEAFREEQPGEPDQEGVPETTEIEEEDERIPERKKEELQELLKNMGKEKLFLVLNENDIEDRKRLKMIEDISGKEKSFSFSTRAEKNWDFLPFQILCCQSEEFPEIYARYTDRACYYFVEEQRLQKREKEESIWKAEQMEDKDAGFQIEIEHIESKREKKQKRGFSFRRLLGKPKGGRRGKDEEME